MLLLSNYFSVFNFTIVNLVTHLFMVGRLFKRVLLGVFDRLNAILSTNLQ